MGTRGGKATSLFHIVVESQLRGDNATDVSKACIEADEEAARPACLPHAPHDRRQVRAVRSVGALFAVGVVSLSEDDIARLRAHAAEHGGKSCGPKGDGHFGSCITLLGLLNGLNHLVEQIDGRRKTLSSNVSTKQALIA